MDKPFHSDRGNGCFQKENVILGLHIIGNLMMEIFWIFI